jgi:hypothetical protein
MKASDSKTLVKMNRLSLNVAETSLKSRLLIVHPEQEEDRRLCIIYANTRQKELLFVRLELFESACKQIKEDQAQSVIKIVNFEQ